MAGPDLSACSPEELAGWLLRHRFAGNPSGARAFWEAGRNVLADETAEGAAAATTPAKEAPSGASFDRGAPLLDVPLETSLLAPRAGRVSIQLYENGGLVATSLKDPSTELVVPAEAASHLVLFAKPEDYKLMSSSSSGSSSSGKATKPPGAHLALITLHDNNDKNNDDNNAPSVTFKNKPVSRVCFSLSWTKGVGPTPPTPGSAPTGWEAATDAWKGLLSSALGPGGLVAARVAPRGGSTATPFLSFQPPNQSATTAGMPFVRCYHGVHDGVLFPLREGILFYKPAVFLPRSKLVSIACGRGGQSSSRYVDLALTVAGEDDEPTPMEFTNIQREELGVLNEYIHGVLVPSMKEDLRAGEGSNNDDNDESTEAEAVADEDETEDEATDEEDENFVDDEDDGSEAGSGDEESDEDEDEVLVDNEEDEDGFEVVADDFARELSRSGGIDPDAPRASRSGRKRSPPREEETPDDSSSVAADDDDFEVVAAGASSSTESEDDDEEAEATPMPAQKKSRGS